MTDSTDKTGNNSELDPRFENIAAHVLDALDSVDEQAAVENLIATDSAAEAEYLGLAEAAGHLAIAVPAATPPASLRASLLDQAALETAPTRVPLVAREYSAASSSRSVFSRLFQSAPAYSAAAAVFVIAVAGVLGFQNNQLSNEVDVLRAELVADSTAIASIRSELTTTMSDSETKVASMKSEMETMENDFGATTEMVVHQEEMVSELAIANTALRQALRDQSWLTYVAMNEEYELISWLANTQSAVPEQDASGLIAIRGAGNEAVFQVQGLEQPQPGHAYTLWLMGNGDPQPVMQFPVSEIGSATVAFLLPAPLQFYSSVVVTQERVNGIGADPAGTMVIFAETN
jgi:hypothetical protein